MGVEACQTMLRGGANDFGGTLMEETISRMAGAEWGIRMEPAEIRTAITSIGRTPVERSTTYERLQRNANWHVRHAPVTRLGAAVAGRTPSDARFRQGD
jgi:2-iminoacetate synthase ThiH